MKMKSIRLDFAVERAFDHFSDAQIKQAIVDALQEHMTARNPENPRQYVDKRYAEMSQSWRDAKVIEIDGKLALDESLTSAVRHAEVNEYDDQFGGPVFYIP